VRIRAPGRFAADPGSADMNVGRATIGVRRGTAVALLMAAGTIGGCYHDLHKTASVTVLVSQEDEGPSVACSLDLVPVKPVPNWRIDPPPQLNSRGALVWFPEMGYFESWPTQFRATVRCPGYEPWVGVVESQSAFRPSISIDAVVRKAAG
jgi:hypothetical protein